MQLKNISCFLNDNKYNKHLLCIIDSCNFSCMTVLLYIDPTFRTGANI